MKIKETKFEGLLVIEPAVFEDPRGYFFESYNQEKFKLNGITNEFVQDNEAMSSKGILRGLHYQTGSFAQAKLVRVAQGSVLDVVVDIRKNSATYGEFFKIELNAENKYQLLVPRGFAHGYLVLEDQTIFSYKCDNFYNRESEGGIFWNDPKLNIDWEFDKNEIIVSDKDSILPSFGQHKEF